MVNAMPLENGVDIGSEGNETKVCRDFLRNVCRRGKKRCRYLHPDGVDPVSLGSTNGSCRTSFIFCHDFQNNQGCKREDCKFLHCTAEEEEYYRTRGKLPEHILDLAISKGQTIDVTPRPGEPPVCKDYLKGECRRGGQCKFRHLTKREYERELGYSTQSPTHSTVSELQPQSQPQQQPQPQGHLPVQTQPQPQPQLVQPQPQLQQHQPPPLTMVQYGHSSQIHDSGPPDQKRFHYAPAMTNPQNAASAMPPPSHRHHPYSRPPSAGNEGPPGMMVLHTHQQPAPQSSQPSPPYGLPPPPPPPPPPVSTAPQHRLLTPAEARSLMLEEENVVLRRRLEELKKQVSDLTVTNEFLLDQNAQLRLGSSRTTTSLTALTVPAVTITNAGQPLSAQLTSAQTPAPQQMMVAAGTLRTVAASVATVPVSIAAVAGTPVSIATVSMAPVTIPPPIVTMAQQTIGVSGPQAIGVSGPPPPTLTAGAPPPQSAQPQNPATACPQSLPLAITAGTAPLVTYPIPVLQTSLSH